MRLSFPSLARSTEVGYCLETSWDAFWDQLRKGGRCRFVNDRAGFFLTYGDGLVQHSPESAVTVEYLGDYCASLVTYLVENPQHREFAADKLRSCFDERRHWRELITFFMGLRYDESKPNRYYSTHCDFFCKVSGAESKRHDTRWKPIPTEADGKPEFVWNRLSEVDDSIHSCALECWHAREMFRRLYSDLGGWCSVGPAEYLKLESGNGVTWAVEALRSMVQGTTLIMSAINDLERHNRNLIPA